MFKKDTVFVVGAGASAEFGLPVGSALSETISNLLYFEFDTGIGLSKGDRDLYYHLARKYVQRDELNKRLSAMRHVSEGIFLASSIDNFIDMHRSMPFVAEVGKLGIAVALTNAESSSKLVVSQSHTSNVLELRDLRETWIDGFTRILFEKVPDSEIERIGENVSIICFNYDRCIEAYLIEAISQTYRVGYQRAHGIVSAMNIVHPYGTLGPLPVDRMSPAQAGALRIGDHLTNGLSDPWPIVERLKTYSEQIEDADMMERLGEMVRGAKQIVFLGFGFHPQNMQLLTVDKVPTSERSKFVIATGVGVSDREADEVQRRILQLYEGTPTSLGRKRVLVEGNTNCADLIARHRRNLSEA